MASGSAVATAAATATAIYRYTYTLGRSLYVPVTSRCNSVPLPMTRGPGFRLPRHAAEALARFREAELAGSPVGGLTATENGPCDSDWNDEDGSGLVALPPYDVPLVNGIYDFGGSDLKGRVVRCRQERGAGGCGEDGAVENDGIEPSISSIVDEVSSRLGHDPDFDQVVVAGEGEPTLRMDALLAVARRVGDGERRLPVRVLTNGLCYGIENLGYSPRNADRSGVVMPMLRHVILRDMMEAGVSRLSVALHTENRHKYDILMEPCCHTGGGPIGGGLGNGIDRRTKNGWGSTLMPGTAHDIVCEFIGEACKVGFEVDLTGVDRPEIDKQQTERLARLLMSVSPRHRRRHAIRWRRYFSE